MYLFYICIIDCFYQWFIFILAFRWLIQDLILCLFYAYYFGISYFPFCYILYIFFICIFLALYVGVVDSIIYVISFQLQSYCFFSHVNLPLSYCMLFSSGGTLSHIFFAILFSACLLQFSRLILSSTYLCLLC